MSLGARWSGSTKKWYVFSKPENYLRLSKWILKDRYDAVIATEFVYIIEGEQRCWKCGWPTKIAGLGLGEFEHIYGGAENPHYEYIDECMNPGGEFHLAWAEKESDIPPKILEYLESNYSLRTSYSKSRGRKFFSNHCDHCGIVQVNEFVFCSERSPLSSQASGHKLKERMSKLKIKCIPINDNLLLNWKVILCANDSAYLEYADCENLILSTNPITDYVSYKELYNR